MGTKKIHGQPTSKKKIRKDKMVAQRTYPSSVPIRVCSPRPAAGPRQSLPVWSRDAVATVALSPQKDTARTAALA